MEENQASLKQIFDFINLLEKNIGDGSQVSLSLLHGGLANQTIINGLVVRVDWHNQYVTRYVFSSEEVHYGYSGVLLRSFIEKIRGQYKKAMERGE